MNFVKHKVIFTFFLLLLALLSFNSASSQPLSTSRILIYAIGNWSGNFDTDPSGRNGLAALKTMMERERALLESERGGVVLLSLGNLTGATGPEQFIDRLIYPALIMPRYLNFDAISLSETENRYLYQYRSNEELALIPFLSFNIRPSMLNRLNPDSDPKKNEVKKTYGEDNPFRPYRIITRRGMNLFVTGITKGDPIIYDDRPSSRLSAEWTRQTGVDLFVTLLAKKDENQRQEWSYLDPLDSLTFKGIPRPPLQKMVVMEGGADRSLFYRDPAGPYICRIHKRDVCKIEITFRNRKIIAVNQQFIDLNGINSPSSWIEPDPLLLKTLKREP